MSYSLYDVNGYVGDLATISGLALLRKYVKKTKKKHILGFIDKGAGLLTEVLLKEVADSLPVNKNVKSTMDNLKVLLEKASLVAIINNGVS